MSGSDFGEDTWITVIMMQVTLNYDQPEKEGTSLYNMADMGDVGRFYVYHCQINP